MTAIMKSNGLRALLPRNGTQLWLGVPMLRMTSTEFKKIAQKRKDEANLLFDSRSYGGAYYLAGLSSGGQGE
jgi:hypothetical protein